MLRVPYQVLRYPYGLKNDPGSGPIAMPVWNLLDGQKFWSNNNVKALKYILMHTLDLSPENSSKNLNLIDRYERALRAAVSSRMAIDNVNIIGSARAMTGADLEKDLDKNMEDAKKDGADLVLLIIPFADRNAYRIYKNSVDRVHGVRSICMTPKHRE